MISHLYVRNRTVPVRNHAWPFTMNRSQTSEQIQVQHTVFTGECHQLHGGEKGLMSPSDWQPQGKLYWRDEVGLHFENKIRKDLEDRIQHEAKDKGRNMHYIL